MRLIEIGSYKAAKKIIESFDQWEDSEITEKSQAFEAIAALVSFKKAMHELKNDAKAFAREGMKTGGKEEDMHDMLEFMVHIEMGRLKAEKVMENLGGMSKWVGNAEDVQFKGGSFKKVINTKEH